MPTLTSDQLAELRTKRLAHALSDHDHVDQLSDGAVSHHPRQVATIVERLAVEFDDDVSWLDGGSFCRAVWLHL